MSRATVSTRQDASLETNAHSTTIQPRITLPTPATRAMPASTRRTNKDANFEAYYSKKVPKQVYFPHRRKVVREKPGEARRDVAEPKQMRFLPEMMRRRSTIDDSEGEDEDEVEIKEEVEALQEDVRRRDVRGKKRSSEIMQDSEGDEDTDDEPVFPAPKRLRQAAQTKSRRREPVASVESAPMDDDVRRAASISTSESEIENTHIPRLRRQSTMTQLVEGRRPQPGDKEPEFKPVKRGSRSSLGKAKEKDAKQRTITQMVRGFAPVGDSEDEETEDEVLEEQSAYTNALVEHLNQSGAFEPATREADECDADSKQVGMDIADDEDDEDEDYLPTQDVRPATVAKRQTPRRTAKPALATPTTSTPRKGRKSRFSLLATPERRKILEIPSSQSPPESPLSTQNTPAGRRSALRQRSGNTQKPLDTPSKRKKVAFQMDVAVVKPQPSSGRKFPSFIQDSEDEDSENLEETEDEATEGVDIGAETQNIINRIDNAATSKSIGTETQAILDQIDQACAVADDDEMLVEREGSIELGDEVIEPPHLEESPELGEPLERGEHNPHSPEGPESTYHTAHIAIKQEPHSPLPPATTEPVGNMELPLPPSRKDSGRIKNEDSSSPTTIKDEHEEDEDEPPTSPFPRCTTTQPPPTCDATDLDGELIQVRRSVTPSKPETQETNRSFSSRAEQQLQSEQQEWLSFSQYPRPPPSSSMRVVQDVFSYQQSPFVGPASLRPAPPQWSVALSQASTVDPSQRSPNVTPKKSRSRIASTNTTPRKIPSSQPIISPQRPATLVIPSSYPSPDKASYGGWSSPLLGRSEGGESVDASIVDFSLPPLPPVIDDEEE